MSLVESLSNHFEIIMVINIGLAIMVATGYIGVQLKFVNYKKLFSSTLRNVFYLGVFTVQVFLLMMSTYVYWTNYTKPADILEFPRDVRLDTSWIKDSQIVYFVEKGTLYSVQVNGDHQTKVYESVDPIREYHFSPDGKYMTILTSSTLVLLDRKKGTKKELASLEGALGGEANKGVISGIAWAPDSQKLIFEVARWSQYSSQENLFVYEVTSGKQKRIQTPTRKISSLYWDLDSQNLYYLHYEAKDTSTFPDPFEIQIFKISLNELTPKHVARIPYQDRSLPLEHLKMHRINLFLDGDHFRFKREDLRSYWTSEEGVKVGIDDHDHLYYVNKQWFRKRLFQIPRRPIESDIARYQYTPGELVIEQLRWIPGERYVIMHHRYMGVLVMEPATGDIGILANIRGDIFGWYQPLNERM